MTDLSSLIARLEKAEGPSYSLEVEIAHITGFWPDERIYRVTRNDDGHLQVWFTEGPSLPLPPPVTGSIDAAVSLAERVLPSHQINVTKFTSTVAQASIGNGWLAAANHKTPALALVLATLRALQQKGSSNE